MFCKDVINFVLENKFLCCLYLLIYSLLIIIGILNKDEWLVYSIILVFLVLVNICLCHDFPVPFRSQNQPQPRLHRHRRRRSRRRRRRQEIP